MTAFHCENISGRWRVDRGWEMVKVSIGGYLGNYWKPKRKKKMRVGILGTGVAEQRRERSTWVWRVRKSEERRQVGCWVMG